MPSVFSLIVHGDIPCYKVAEDEKHLAFLDINPIAIGHTLVIPKKEVDYLFDLEDDDLSQLICFAKRVAASIKKNIACKKVAMIVLGLEVAHAHIHLIPINDESDVDFKRKLSLSESKFQEIRELIVI